MRHRKVFNHLGRPVGHRKALLMNLAKGLIMRKRITTTLAKAKALRRFIEPIFTKAKVDTMHARRIVFSMFQDKAPVKELCHHIVEKIQNRPGGYTRIIKLVNRLGDHADMAMIELVDYNSCYVKNKPILKPTRRSRKTKNASDQGIDNLPPVSAA